VKIAFEVTYTVSGGALTSTQSNLPGKMAIRTVCLWPCDSLFWRAETGNICVRYSYRVLHLNPHQSRSRDKSLLHHQVIKVCLES